MKAVLLFALIAIVCCDSIYFDETRDLEDRTKYYGKYINQNSVEMDSDALANLLRSTHRKHIDYKDARNMLFQGIDRQENGELRCIYSNRILEHGTGPRFMLRGGQGNYNCEHSVPQSYFKHKTPMKGDMHHLFTAESECNSFRSSFPFGTFNTSRHDAVMNKLEGCGSVFSLSSIDSFEPMHGKGVVARAFLYFITRYPGIINLEEMTNENVNDILRWAREEKVTVYERHRNSAIFIEQGNRNPFIDFPELVNTIDFSKALNN
jgi:hypothetical protein